MTKVSFCGISGSGMSALAQILKLRGNEVYGSDRSFDQGKDEANKKALEEIGIVIKPQDGSAVADNLEMLYVSTAVEDSIPDVKAALEKNIPIKKRSDLLAEIFHQYPYNIAVGGTSGKTTTTAMIGYILDTLGKKPCVINGGLLLNYTGRKGIPNIIYNQGDICVIEADESDGSIEKYHPYVALINNITLDHKPVEELRKLFADFARRARGGVVVNADCEACADIRSPDKTNLTFSIEGRSADFSADHIRPLPDGTEYKFDGRTFRLKLIGRFNVANALAAIAAVAATIGRLAMDVCLFMSQNFGFVSLPDELTTGSSIMPHKKNPDVFEIMRGRCNRLQSVPNEIALLTTNLPVGYHRDLQLLKDILFPATTEIKRTLAMCDFMLAHIRVNEHILDDKKYDYLFTVEDVNRMVLAGTPFREAYKQVGMAVQRGEYTPTREVRHTHEGSIGNLCTAQIRRKMERVMQEFE